MPKNLLLADDSAVIQKVVQIAFAHEDVAVTVASGADDALAKARAHKPDVFVIDTFMPGKSGYDLVASIRADGALSNLPVLLLASPNEPFNEAKAQQLRADAWIPKPFQTGALIEQVKKLLSAPRPSAPPPPRAAAIIPPPPLAAAKPPAAPKPPTAPPPARPSAPVPPPAAAKPSAPVPPRPAAPVPPAAAKPPSPTAPPPAKPTAPPNAATVSNRPAVQAPAAPTPAAAKPAAPLPPAPKPVAPAPPGAPVRPPPQLQVTAQNHAALLREAIGTASREMIEKVVWEVVPELAEIMIRERLAKLAKERDDLG